MQHHGSAVSAAGSQPGHDLHGGALSHRSAAWLAKAPEIGGIFPHWTEPEQLSTVMLPFPRPFSPTSFLVMAELGMLQVEASQSMIRIVGLSATLPNYTDVAAFLGVNVDTGLFFFDASYRPVPLEMQFVGVTAKPMHEVRSLMDTIAYNKVQGSLDMAELSIVASTQVGRAQLLPCRPL